MGKPTHVWNGSTTGSGGLILRPGTKFDAAEHSYLSEDLLERKATPIEPEPEVGLPKKVLEKYYEIRDEVLAPKREPEPETEPAPNEAPAPKAVTKKKTAKKAPARRVKKVRK